MSLPFNHGTHPELVTRSPKRPKRRHLTTASDRDYNSNYSRSTVNSVKTPSIIGLENLRMHPSEEYTVDVVQPRNISYQPLSTKAPIQAFLPNVTQQWEGRQRTTVYVTGVFLKIGEIQTIKEYFEADVYIQAKWREPVLDKTRTKVSDFSQFWNPELVLQNVFEDPKEKIWHEVRYTPRGEAFIHEMRRVKAKFFETMELNHFPFDIQEIHRTVCECMLDAFIHGHHHEVTDPPEPVTQTDPNHTSDRTPDPPTTTDQTTSHATTMSMCDYLCSIQEGGAACYCSAPIVPG